MGYRFTHTQGRGRNWELLIQRITHGETTRNAREGCSKIPSVRNTASNNAGQLTRRGDSPKEQRRDAAALLMACQLIISPSRPPPPSTNNPPGSLSSVPAR